MAAALRFVFHMAPGIYWILSHPWLRGTQRPDEKTLSTFPSLSGRVWTKSFLWLTGYAWAVLTEFLLSAGLSLSWRPQVLLLASHLSSFARSCHCQWVWRSKGEEIHEASSRSSDSHERIELAPSRGQRRLSDFVIFGPLARNCRRTLLTQLTDRF